MEDNPRTIIVSKYLDSKWHNLTKVGNKYSYMSGKNYAIISLNYP